MRVAYVITRADAVGGASVHVRDLASGLIAAGHEAAVFIGGTGPVTRQLTSAGVPFLEVPLLRREIDPARDLRAVAELAGALRGWRPDLVSVHTAKAGLIGRAASVRLGLPVIYTPHGWTIGDRISRAHGMLFGFVERVSARWADAIVCVCEYERRLALERRIAPPGRLHVIYNGVRDSALRARPEAEPPRIVSVARFEEPKDHATLVDALALLSGEEWQLDLVGDGPLEPAVRARAGALGIAGRVRFLGYQPEPAEALANAQIFALSSRSEGFPRSILEAMRAGLPVVASDVGGVAEAVGHGANGLLVPRRNAAALAGALGTLIRDSSERQRLGLAARQTYEQRFNAGRMVVETTALYAKVLRAS